MDETEENLKKLLQETEDLFFALGNNLSLDGRDNAFHIIEYAKKHSQENLPAWTAILTQVQQIINGFENNLSQKSEMALLAIRQQAQDLIQKSTKPVQ